MTTAHRPTFDPARGKSNSSAPTRQYSSRSLPAHKKLKYRQPGQGGQADASTTSETLREDLLAAERKHYHQQGGDSGRAGDSGPAKLRKRIEGAHVEEEHNKIEVKDLQTKEEGEEEPADAKRRRILEETRDIDADDSGSDDDGDNESSEESEDEDETAELMRELEKIKAERAAEKARKEAELAAEERARREEEIAFGNPLMNDPADFSLKRRWDEDVVFRVKEKDESGKKDFVNDMLRSDFHRSFMKKYVR